MTDRSCQHGGIVNVHPEPAAAADPEGAADICVRALPSWIDPAALYLGGPALSDHSFWLDAGPNAREGWSLLGIGVADARPPLGHAGTGGSSATDGGPFRGGWVGWFGYDAAAAKAGAAASDESRMPSVAGLRVSRFVAADHAARRLWITAPRNDIDQFADEVAAWAAGSATSTVAEAIPANAPVARARHSPAEYAELIGRCRDAIRAGDAYQLCLTTRFDLSGRIDPVSTYLRLRRASPAPHGGIIRVGEHALVSSSPEQFLRVAGGTVRTRPIKGTRARDRDPAIDAARAIELRADPKERAENVMIVDLMRNDLQRVSEAGSVVVEDLLEVESFPAVHQLVSAVVGRLHDGVTLGQVLDATFPAGSMTGAPKLSAMTILHRLEAAPRGVFAGCFGWVGRDGDADLAMVIRSIAVHPGGGYVGAGGGITWLSDPAAEVAEVSVKARGPLAAVGCTPPDGW